jgi:hypothetical protein
MEGLLGPHRLKPSIHAIFGTRSWCLRHRASKRRRGPSPVQLLSKQDFDACPACHLRLGLPLMTERSTSAYLWETQVRKSPRALVPLQKSTHGRRGAGEGELHQSMVTDAPWIRF